MNKDASEEKAVIKTGIRDTLSRQASQGWVVCLRSSHQPKPLNMRAVSSSFPERLPRAPQVKGHQARPPGRTSRFLPNDRGTSPLLTRPVGDSPLRI